jgi:hypothetical protein
MRAEGDRQTKVREDDRRGLEAEEQSGANGKGGRRQIGCTPGAVHRPAKTPHSSLSHPARPCQRRRQPRTTFAF